MIKNTLKIDVDVKSELELVPDDGFITIPLGDALEFINEAKLKGATHIQCYIGTTEWGRDYFDGGKFNGIFYREETDDEFNARVKEKDDYNASVKSRKLQFERQEYLRLKSKFETNE